ncbi:MAG: ankyrin repeat domain-containing protein [Parachlamydiaceae bacterium]|nr:ankyrin repeat domain-containing protein [Parachlamydiaceae bacterium]
MDSIKYLKHNRNYIERLSDESNSILINGINPESNLQKLIKHVNFCYPKFLIPHDQSITDYFKNGTPCHFSIQHFDRRLLLLIIALGVDVNQVDHNKDNALMVACKILSTGNTTSLLNNCIHLLLNAGCDPLHKNISNVCPLELLSKLQFFNSEEIIAFLDKLSSSRLPLASGLLHITDSLDLIDYLLAKNIHVDTLNSNGKTPLFCAFEKLKMDVVKHLLIRGADISITLPYEEMAKNRLGKRSLYTKVSDIYLEKMIELFKFIKESGRDINEIDVNGDSPMIIICRTIKSEPASYPGNAKLVNFLIELGCDLTQQNHAGECAIELLAHSGFFNNHQIQSFFEQIPSAKLPLAAKVLHYTRDIDLIKLLVNAGISIDTLDQHGYTPLQRAIQMSDITFITFLLSMNADMRFIQPFHMIAHTNSIETLEFFHKLGCDINELDQCDNNALMIACNGIEPTKPSLQTQLFIDKLLFLGCSPVQKNVQGVCAAELLVKQKVFPDSGLLNFFKLLITKFPLPMEAVHHTLSKEIINLYIENGFLVDSFDYFGRTLLHKAVDRLELDLIMFLIEKGANSVLKEPEKYKRADWITPQKLLIQKIKMANNTLSAIKLQTYQLEQLEKCKDASYVLEFGFKGTLDALREARIQHKLNIKVL